MPNDIVKKEMPFLGKQNGFWAFAHIRRNSLPEISSEMQERALREHINLL